MTSTTKKIVIPYEPRAHFQAFHNRNQRWSCLLAHRRAGKTVATINDLVARALYTQKTDARYGYIAPLYTQAKEIAWNYLKKYTQGIATKVLESELAITLPNGARIRLYGADNPDAFRGMYFDGVVLDEYGDMKPSVWSKVILPTLVDRRGWAVFIGTPKGKNHFYKIYQRAQQNPSTWFSAKIKGSESGILGQEELLEMQSQMSEDEYEQEVECSFEAALIGAIWGREMRVADEQGRISKLLEPDPSQPTHAVLDLGFTDDTAIWFWQTRPGGFLLTKSFAENNQPIDYYIELFHNFPYPMGDIWLPHDARAKSLQTGKSIVEQFLAAGIRPRLVPNLAIRDGISAARKVFPQCYFSLPGCEDGTEALKQYQRKWDEDKKIFSEKPEHDWTSHYGDSFRYFAIVVRPDVKEQETPEQKEIREAENGMNLHNLFADYEKSLRGKARIQ